MINDRILGLLGLMLAVAYGYAAQHFQEPFGGVGAISPSAFPTLLAITMGLSSLYMMVKPDTDDKWPALKVCLELLAIAAVLFCFVVVLEFIGFVIASSLTITLLSKRMGADYRGAALVGVAASVSMFLIFTYGLDITLPIGSLWGMS